jgi:outer membrane protein assembly factor BamB
MYLSAPILADGTLYGISNKRKGQFVALDAATGAVRWATEGREGDHASILLTSSHVLFMTNAGNLVVVRRDPTKFAEERRIEITESETWAVPVFVPGGLVIRDAQGLVRLQWES